MAAHIQTKKTYMYIQFNVQPLPHTITTLLNVLNDDEVQRSKSKNKRTSRNKKKTHNHNHKNEGLRKSKQTGSERDSTIHICHERKVSNVENET